MNLAELRRTHREQTAWPSFRKDPRASADGYLHYCHPCGNVPWPCPVTLLLDVVEASVRLIDSGGWDTFTPAADTSSTELRRALDRLVAS